MKEFVFFLSIITLPLNFLFSEEGKKSYKDGHPIKKRDMIHGYSSPARIKTNGLNFFLKGSFIYWFVKENGLDIAYVKGNQVSTDKVKGHYIKQDFEYKPGFKIQAGKSFDHDDWEVSLDYTWLHFTNSKTHLGTIPNATIDAVWDSASNLTYAKAKWKFSYDMLDGLIGRRYYLGTKLLVKPFIGLRGGWIDQKNETAYTTLTESIEGDFKSKSYLVGPIAGLEADYFLGYNLKFISKSFLCLAYQEFHTSLLNLAGTNNILTRCDRARQRESKLTPNIDLLLGLGWGDFFFNDKIHFELNASYDFQYFWQQNSMKNLVTAEINNRYNNSYENLFLHGLTFSARIDF